MGDTALLNWLELRWRQDDDCPLTLLGDSFVPICESGTWDTNMTLRQAIRAAMKSEEEGE